MKPEITEELQTELDREDRLSRWERTQLARALRANGRSYGEIIDVMPVAKSTLATWCRDVPLTTEQIQNIQLRTGSRKGIPRDTQRRRRQQIEELRSDAVSRLPNLIGDPIWLAGTVMYWAEGAKTGRALQLSNADARALGLFIRWVRRFHDPRPAFALQLHLHEGNNEGVAQARWIEMLSLEGTETSFHRTYMKPNGTGHRKNHLEYGVCRVRLKKGADAYHRTMAWIDALADLLAKEPSSSGAILAPGR